MFSIAPFSSLPFATYAEDQNVDVSGISGVTALGSVAVHTDPVTGVSGVAVLGTVGVSGDQNTEATGVEGVSGLGVVTATGDQNITVSGLSGITALGVVTATGDQNITVSGVAAVAYAGRAITQTIQQAIQSPAAFAYVELFILDLSEIPGLGALTYYLTPSAGDTNTVVWGGDTFQPWPLEIVGVEASADGAPARPTLNIGNLDANKLIGTLVFQYSDIIGAKVTYIRTFEPYLGGIGSISMPPLKYVIGKKNAHDDRVISFELRSPLDKERSYLPNRQMLKRDFPGLGINKQIR
jgi:lambda family phage minor tail protein L